jgi:hypothetical protein
MSGSIVTTIRQDVARLHEHVERVDNKVERMDDKVDTMCVQFGVLDTHVTNMLKEQARTTEQVGELRNLKFQVLGGMGVIGFLLFLAAEALRILFH